MAINDPAGVVRLAFLFVLIPRLKSVGEVIEQVFERLASTPIPNVAVTSGGSSRLVVVQSANTVHIPQSEETH
jgi:hypothetical protein